MCPPSEPIRSIGPLDGGTYVERSTPLGATRRRQRDEDRSDQQGEQRQHDQQDELLETWSTPNDAAHDAGAYDDHGRPVGADHEPVDLGHIDTTA